MSHGRRQLRRFLAGRPLLGATVLVVEDDEDSRTLLRQMVEWFGARVHTAASGPEALAWLEKRIPDLLLLDLRMPGMDGFTVFQRVRSDRRFSKVRAIAVTALGSDEDVMRTWQAGFDGHLVKPVDFETLALALNRAFWAHSGQVRFSISRVPAGGTRSSASRSPRDAPVHIAGVVGHAGDRGADTARPGGVEGTRPAPRAGLYVVRGGGALANRGDDRPPDAKPRRRPRPGRLPPDS